jgi:hypothetical protein
LYSGLNAVISFGRTAKFDYLTMLKKTGLLEAEPGHAFLNGATGPSKEAGYFSAIAGLLVTQ